MSNVIRLKTEKDLISEFEHMLKKARFASGLSDIFATYSGTLTSLIESEPNLEAKALLSEIQGNLIDIIDGPIMRLFSCYDDLAGGLNCGDSV
jgi:hypothetical protein